MTLVLQRTLVKEAFACSREHCHIAEAGLWVLDLVGQDQSKVMIDVETLEVQDHF